MAKEPPDTGRLFFLPFFGEAAIFCLFCMVYASYYLMYDHFFVLFRRSSPAGKKFLTISNFFDDFRLDHPTIIFHQMYTLRYHSSCPPPWSARL